VEFIIGLVLVTAFVIYLKTRNSEK